MRRRGRAGAFREGEGRAAVRLAGVSAVEVAAATAAPLAPPGLEGQTLAGMSLQALRAVSASRQLPARPLRVGVRPSPGHLGSVSRQHGAVWGRRRSGRNPREHAQAPQVERSRQPTRSGKVALALWTSARMRPGLERPRHQSGPPGAVQRVGRSAPPRSASRSSPRDREGCPRSSRSRPEANSPAESAQP